MRKLILASLLAPAVVFGQAATPPAPTKAPPAKKPEVYKWTDDKGVVHYTDKPPSKDAQPANLPALQTYKRGTNPDLSKYSAPSKSGKPVAGGSWQIQVVTPSAQETFRGGERTVPVGVMVTPTLAPDQKLVYQLDGEAVGNPTPDTSFAFTEVERGEHTVTVTLVDAGGRELGRSPPVTFYMQQPGGRKK